MLQLKEELEHDLAIERTRICLQSQMHSRLVLRVGIATQKQQNDFLQAIRRFADVQRYVRARLSPATSAQTAAAATT